MLNLLYRSTCITLKQTCTWKIYTCTCICTCRCIIPEYCLCHILLKHSKIPSLLTVSLMVPSNQESVNCNQQ